MKTLHAFGLITGVLLSAAAALPVLAEEPPDAIAKAMAEAEERLSKMTPEELSARFNEPKKPKEVAELREEYEGSKPLELQLEFLLAIRNGRAEEAKRLLGELATVFEENGPDPWGMWVDLPEWHWKRGEPTEVYELDFDGLFHEAALQATVANNPAVWEVLRPLLERLVAHRVTSLWSTVMLAGAMKDFENLLPRIHLDAPLILYRFGKTTTARETAVCFLAAGNALKVGLLEAILEAGAKPEVRCLDDWTPLALAIMRGNLGKVRVLLEHGAGPNTTSHGFTPLRLVEAAGLNEVISRELNKMLVEHGAIR